MDPAPIFHPALRVRNWASLNRSGSDALSLVIKSLAVVSRIPLEPQQHLAPNAFEGILAGTPVTRRASSRLVGRSSLALLLQTGKPGQKPANAFTMWSFQGLR